MRKAHCTRKARNLQQWRTLEKNMNPRTQKGQRKVSQMVKKMKPKKTRVEKADPSCDNPGCGCGN